MEATPTPVEGGHPRPPTLPSQIFPVFYLTPLFLSFRRRRAKPGARSSSSGWYGHHANVIEKRLDSRDRGLTRAAYHGMIRLEGSTEPYRKGRSLVAELNLDIHLSGRKAAPLNAEVLRELTESDIALLSTERGIKPTALQRITDRHHALARCLASGMSAVESGLVTGYTASRISILRGDPAFEELIEFYREAKGEAVRDFQDKAAMARNLATDLLIERMDEAPETFDAAMALDVAKTFADRTGHGPKQTNVNVNLNLGDRMKAARERAALLPAVRVGRDEVSHEASLAPTIIDGHFTEVDRGS